ncbi:Rne/Rng family ribonuclease [Hyphobacterium marinum]|uniref:Ribonuclease E n=1 Tax=Hyphobacterium marinum TaxID=3116574 RepID=A0ABU7M153_9PROT|nr:ribonuclease E/G [Hyphobacterium sp. Y6023]MEE2567257.1 ribonuclease E/G [Hyphobacterium sp. Y6023]
MSKTMLIDAGHPEETRVVVVEGSKVEEFDFEAAAKKPIRGNIYLAKVTRVEPSLQAAFVEYGGNRHGFLAFNEIHPDYYQIPHEDRVALQEEEAKAAEKASEEAESDGESDDDEDEAFTAAARRQRQQFRRYKIQEVIKRRQILLVQVAKEERGSKGAALTTYLSLAGRYCVLMPNTPRGGGISRKISSAKDRNRLKDIVADLDTPRGMGLIIRTAGAARTKAEIRRDYDYLRRVWDLIRETTMASVAPSLIYEEGDLVKRAIRDLYDKDVEQVLVQGEAAYKDAKSFIKMLMPSHAAKVQPYKEDVPLFQRYKVEGQLEAIYDAQVQLKSGGYLVINPTEALVAIDVNSGRATRERNIEATALKTNLEAADEAARQMRLRDLAGLVVIDFIDMEENKNVRAVEKRMKDALRKDRARLQMGRISQFGLMEISRQRKRTSILEGSTIICPHCNGLGYVRSVESSALVALRALEEEGARRRAGRVRLSVPTEVALYLLNEKRDHVLNIESGFGMRILISADPDLTPPDCKIDILDKRGEGEEPDTDPVVTTDAVADLVEAADEEAASEDSEESGGQREGRGRGRRRRGRGRGRRGDNSERDSRQDEASAADGENDADDADGEASGDKPAQADKSDDDGQPRKRRRRGRRGGRGRRRRSGEDGNAAADNENTQGNDDNPEGADDAPDALAVIQPDGGDLPTAETPPKRERPARKAKTDNAEDAPAEAVAEDAQAEDTAEEKPKPRRRRKKADADAPAEDAAVDATADEAAAEEKPKLKSRTRRKKAEPKAEDAKADTDEAEAKDAGEAPKPKRRRAPAKAKAEAKPESETPAKTGPANEADAKADPVETGDGDSPKSDAPKKKGWWQRGAKLLGG